MAEEQSKIPTSKIERTGKFVRTGLKVGGNYMKHYAKKLVNKNTSREELDEANAKDIYDTLSNLKGSALKVAQMLSMDRGILPAAFSDQFSQAQHKAPPLSGPLIVKTFKQYLDRSPQELFDHFEMKATHAASIGQVHKAVKNGETLAVKIQYPGVGDSVVSDLNMVRPVARQMFGWKDQDLSVYFEEVKARLIEETDYELELNRSMEISEQCKDLPNLVFAQYYPEYSAERIITMSWLQGHHLDDFLALNPNQEVRNSIGQALWDFYNYQIHQLRQMHADAHPGNYLFREDGSVAILDFGCVKVIPEQFYDNYFAMLKPGILQDEGELYKSLVAAQIIFEEDSEDEKKLYMDIAREALEMVLTPFHREEFDFSEGAYFDRIYAYGEKMGRSPVIRNTRVPRGDADGIYLNRTYFGLFSILNKLGAKVKTRNFMPSF